MKAITDRAMRFLRARLGPVVREVTARPFSGAFGFSFCVFLGACWGVAFETAVLSLVALSAAERRGISVKWG
jgi:hypothetical protein